MNLEQIKTLTEKLNRLSAKALAVTDEMTPKIVKEIETMDFYTKAELLIRLNRVSSTPLAKIIKS